MRTSRRDLMKMGVAAGMAVSIPSILRAQTTDARTVRMVMGDLQVFDPVFTTSDITQFHGLAIYDTLFALDVNLVAQPQMVGKWMISEDQKTYTFELRDGLKWHDGTPVKAVDCVASIHRWGQVDPSGQLLLERAADISAKDDKTFTILLKEPFALVLDLLANTAGRPLFIMREQDAKLPATEQVTANIGSGPFKFNLALTKPGSSVTYDRNEHYVPRQEPASEYAGGKVVNVDRVVWENITDPQTAVAALQAGEVDFLLQPSADLFPAIESDTNLQLQVLGKSGSDYYARINFLQKPFDNIKARQALLHLIDQEAFLAVLSPDPKYGGTVTSLFGSGTAYSNDENTGWFKKGGNPEKAKQLFQEAGYAGEKVLILTPTDWPEGNNASQFLAATLQKIGVNAELAPMTWSELSARRENKGPVENGGWSIFITTQSDFSLGNPIGSSFFLANGEKAWYGWPKSDEFETLRAKWADVGTVEERKELAREMQQVWWDFVGTVFLCRALSPSAHRTGLVDLVTTQGEYRPMWNMKKV
ncbi:MULTISPECIES: ABC transporter substrate-binding protein [Rhizobium]|uniref:ABC transporter substrate-binding protein n=1 Tax=Rhizobium TaxID=379 RepID=UPI001F15947A|nr:MULTISPECIES: ABC transporter substrate-binding protein [Rhizobium]UIJ82316.1 ABC transporter substrate-binding protein [Rhizobium leguminosarum]UTS88972.1 ABC transporter substrate-binding protein [Rhizobium anhuiense bv. trifolii]